MDNVEVDYEVEDSEFSSNVDTLVNMFGNVLNKDVITAVMENCAGDLNLSAEAIMSITMTSGNSSQNTDSDVRPITNNLDEIDSTMDLISFTSNDDNLTLHKVDTNESTTGNSIPPQVVATIEPTINDDPIRRENVKSTLNVDACIYIPRATKEAINTDIYSNPMTVSVDRPQVIFEKPLSTCPKNKTESIPENNTFQSQISYSNLTRLTGAVPKTLVKSLKNESGPKLLLSPQLRRMAEYHSKNIRTLIIMRGAPGSGKSYLSRQVIQATVGESVTNFKNHIFSTDDFFCLRGPYEFNKYYLRDAHAWNQQRARSAMERGLSPVIIDNTNIEIWEMEPYIQDGVKNGYIIDIMEPKTPWARKPHQLMKKNIHGVPLSNISRMLDNYEENLTGNYLINYFKLSYPDNMTPPVTRLHPPVVSSILNNEQFVSEGVRKVINKRTSPIKERENIANKFSNHDFVQNETKKGQDVIYFDSKPQMEDNIKSSEYTTPGQISTRTITKSVFPESSSSDVDTNEDNKELMHNSNIRKQIEEFERLDIEWENNPPWYDNTQNDSINKKYVRTEPKPPRKFSPSRSGSNEKKLHAENNCTNWVDISMFMKPWSDDVQFVEKEPVILVEMKTTGTSVEIGDTDIFNNQKIYKVISANPRDINENFISPYREKIPEKRMLDKSTMTNDRLITDITRCKNEERHFVAFRKMFKTISKTGLRDIFDQCRGDVNWAVEIVLDGISNNQLQFTNELELSDEEEENSEHCTCLAAYNVVPDAEVECGNQNTDDIPEAITDNAHSNKKLKREVPLSEMSIQLKRQIEQNVVISDNHYSQHCLKIRKLRRGETVTEIEHNSPGNANATVPFPPDQDLSTADLSDEESNASEDLETIVNVNVGQEFIRSMDEMFGRSGITYPENVVPKLSIPISLVNELNALWMESLMHQLDDHDKQSAAMVKQDEEFARQLAAKEMEMAQAGKEPEVPEFKEIMDMDFALSLYQKDIDEWRNKAPDNIAAKMSRNKLYNLFPELPKETLSELLVAHDNNFKATVEVLLMSTGKSEVLEQKNGLVKFVMAKEKERQEKLMEEEKKALSEVEWPLLPKGEKVDMTTVNKFRKNAESHLDRRNKSYEMAQQYIQRGMTSVAAYYSEMASFHKQMFDQANSCAAATLIQVHAQNSPNNATIDLHYLRVAEALETLDLFLDSHISKLQESQASNRGLRSHQLYFITGRGLHSQGGPRVKPAVKRRLRERGIICSERNPGLLCARVSAEDKLSYQIPM